MTGFRGARLAFGVIAVVLASCAAPDETTSSTAAAQSGRVVMTIATVKLTDYAAQLRSLADRDFDIAGVDLDAKEVDLVLARSDVAALTAEGLDVVRTKDVTSDPLEVEEPYQTPAKVEAGLAAYAARFPTLAAVSSIGSSNEGRQIWALKISKDVGSHSADKPVILFNGTQHAREVMSTEIPMDIIDSLLTGYGTDPDVTRWVDSNEIWIVPMVNVDGNNRVWTNDQLWRKNTRGCSSAMSCASGTGVDINRNYPYAWGTCNGSSSSPSSESYRGPSAGSEPETRSVVDLVSRIRPVFDMSFHSYGQMVLYPYGCQGVYTPQKALFTDLGTRLASSYLTDETGGTWRHGTSWEINYSVDGNDTGWMFHEYNVVPFVIELNSARQGFHPKYELWRASTVTKQRAGWKLLLDRLAETGVRGVARDASGAILTDAQVTVTSLDAATSGEATTQTRSVNPDGSYHVVLLAGRYRVGVSAAGHTAFTQDVILGDRRVDLATILP